MKVLHLEISDCGDCPYCIYDDYKAPADYHCKKTDNVIPAKGIEASCPLPDKEEPGQRTTGDLTAFAKEIERLFSDRFCKGEKPSIAIAFTLPPDYKHCRFITNVSRQNGITLFQATAEKMIADMN